MILADHAIAVLTLALKSTLARGLFHIVAVSYCMTCFQTQLIPTTCQICYHGHCGVIVALDSSEPSSRGVTSSTVK